MVKKEKFNLFKYTLRGREGVARQAHNLEVGGSNPPPATRKTKQRLVKPLPKGT